MSKQTDNDNEKASGLMSGEAFQETKEALDDFATWWVNNYAPDVVDVVVEEHIPRLLDHIAAQDKRIAELESIAKQNDYGLAMIAYGNKAADAQEECERLLQQKQAYSGVMLGMLDNLAYLEQQCATNCFNFPDGYIRGFGDPIRAVLGMQYPSPTQGGQGVEGEEVEGGM